MLFFCDLVQLGEGQVWTHTHLWIARAAATLTLQGELE